MKRRSNFSGPHGVISRNTELFINTVAVVTIVLCIVIIMGDYRRGFGLEIGFIDHFITRFATTINFIAIAVLHGCRLTAISCFPRAMIVSSVIGDTFLPRGSVLGDYSPTALAAPSLRPLVGSDSLIRCQWIQVYYHHQRSFPIGVENISGSGQCSYINGSYFVISRLFFRFGEGSPYHNVRTFIFRSLIENSTARSATCSPVICPSFLQNALWPPRRSCRLAPQSFILLLHSGRLRRHFPCVRSLVVPLATLSLFGH
jgi:hypothetical protein